MNGAPSAMVSPGLWGFLAFFVLAIALYLLMRNMNARMRRMSYRSEELQRQAEEQERERDRERERERHGETGDDNGAEGQTRDPRT
ncbi:flagellar biosynthesis/type III secretory pathway M-ring protein FliF/YscJ [Phycicoccus badiiscoriae]|uniref:Flagellar biosynthesis/type III secretory pathway M-ring protein FliF/YscJ n=1 Tax=Pedococcus badiiscoriae TaxID=642776 RepID=A0A852WIK9_9MICO|nr:hypothetical protein [Pedococcus badiiscoriae]NYG07431.1 flagellar biosynthesis/type III secretory pathway M-ring protein FliF/YscJ [Pedococcus badiiscoriae]